MHTKLTFLFSLILILTAYSGFKYEEIPVPQNVDSQVGGLATLPNGNIVACFHRGEVLIYDVKAKTWSRFAEGLHEPLGIVALSNSAVMIMQRPELTLIKDTDGDGEADIYKTFYDDFGMTGNYHEFAFGPVQDKKGNFYISLNVASNGASIRNEIRGEFDNSGIPREQLYVPRDKDYDKKWKATKNAAGRMYSRVPYRGWVLKISPKGEMTPISCGVRSPNGMGIDADGDIFTPDNQGDWLGTSKLHHIKPGRFHGHPASLPWRKDWDGRNPLNVAVKELEKLRTKAAALFPQGILANSPTQPLLIDHDKFGPYKNQMLIGDMNFRRVLRFMKDTVNGQVQGALIPHIDGNPMKLGNNRLTFGNDGALFVGRTKLSWAGDRGIMKVTWDGKIDFDIQNIKLTKTGFKVTFTKPLKKLTKDDFELSSYHYTYHKNYGSPRVDEKKADIKAVSLSANGLSVLIHVKNLTKGKVYDFKLNGVTSKDGKSLKATRMCYTLNELR
ncbi:MAG: hypothetical protein MK132_22865 [Lentisphaerales bacterium]|nr:hypothetical protein [Lentisphaerales bacterium]